MTLLTTRRLRLEPFTEGHLAGLNKLNSDPEVMRYLSAGRPETLEETRAIIERVTKRWGEVGYSWWALLERETEDLVGAGAVQNLRREANLVPDRDCPLEIGWRLRRDRWGQGLATEAGRAMGDFAFKELNAQDARSKELAEGKQPLVAQLARLRAIGLKGAWVLVKEVFGWRHFANRRELASSLGLVPTPYASGDIESEQGISKAGNRRARSLLVEQAWSWIRLQRDSTLTRWFNRLFAGGGKRMRRVGIVAVARRLAVALWRYLQDGEIPAGANLKPAPI
jgi:RimJ/RimL family protein N-acetyltransferase